MANVTITQLPAAGPLSGNEQVAVVQNGITARTAVSNIASVPSSNQTIITVVQEPSLANSRYLSSGTGIGLTDNGPQGSIRIVLNGASASLESVSLGLLVKTGGTNIAARSLAASGSGIQIANGDGIAGNPTLSLNGLVLSLANASGPGIVAMPGNGTVTPREIQGTSSEITVSNGNAASGNPVIGLDDNGVVAGVYGTTTRIPELTVDSKGRISFAQDLPITSLNEITGSISSPNYIQMDVTPTGVPALTAGLMWWDATGTLNIGMGNGNITQQVGEEMFVYGKASANITEGQLVMKTGTVGGSGVITFGPTTAGLTNDNDIIGIATESIPQNSFGRVTSYGVVRGFNTTGAAAGEVWSDGDILWYNPAGNGLMTNVQPTAPDIKFHACTIIKAGSGGSGSVQVNLIHGSTLGGTDSNVLFSPLSGGDLIVYDAGTSLWTNLPQSSINAGSADEATAVTGGAANRILYQTAANVTGFITAPTLANTFLKWNGSAFTFDTIAGSGTVTSVDVSGGTTGLTFSGGPVTTNGTITMAGTLAVANGGTGATDADTALTNLGGTTAGQGLFKLTNPSAITFLRVNADNTVSALNASDFRTAIGAGTGSVTSVDVSGGTTGLTFSGGPVTGSGTITLAGTLAVANGGTGATDANTALTNLGGTTAGQNVFKLANPSAITFLRINADNTVSALNASDFRTAIGAGTGNGSVTSVDVSGGTTGLTFSGGPITGSGTISLGGTLAVGNGGTGATDANTALTNLGGTTAGQNLFKLTNPSAITFLRVNADNTVSALNASDFRTAIGAGTGSGDVVGPSSSTDDAIVRFDGTTGKLIQNSLVTVSDAGVVSATAYVGISGGTF